MSEVPQQSPVQAPAPTEYDVVAHRKQPKIDPVTGKVIAHTSPAPEPTPEPVPPPQ